MTFTYHSVAVTNGKGRRTGISDGAGSTVFEYDPMGRVSRKRRTTLNVTVQLDYAYNRMGGVKRILVPELGDTTVDYAFDNAGRQRTLSFNGGSFRRRFTSSRNLSGLVNRRVVGWSPA